MQVQTANGSVGTSGQTRQSVSSRDFRSSPSISPSTLNLPFIRPLEMGKVSLNHIPPFAGEISPVNRPLSVVENRVKSPPEADAYYFWGNHHAETSDRKLREPNKVQSGIKLLLSFVLLH